MATSIHRARDDARAMRARADGRERWWTSSSSSTTKAEARDARTGTVEEDDGDDGSERVLARVRTNLDARARRGAVGTRGGESETRALFAVSSSTRRREVTTRETRVRAPLRFRLGVDAAGRADARFEVARVDAGERAIEEDAQWRRSGGGGGLGVRATGRVRAWLASGDAHGLAAAACLQVAFPETMRRAHRLGAVLGLLRMTLKHTEGRPGLGALDAPVVVSATRASLATRALATSARLVCPKMYAHATAATALMSVKVLFKQPPWLYGLARAVNGKRSEMSEDERIALWHARYRWAALRLAKHIPSDPVQTIDAAPLMGLMAFVEGLSMRRGNLNAVEGSNGSFSMSFPASLSAARRARRRKSFTSKRAIKAEARIQPSDVLCLARVTSVRTDDASPSPRIAASEEESSRQIVVVEGAVGESVELANGEDEDADANIWRDTQLVTAPWATNGISVALMIRAIYLFVTWLPVLTVTVPMLFLSGCVPDPVSSTMRKRAWATLHSAIALCGAAFIKWAQWASTREDVFPKDLCRQLEQLHDDAPQHSHRQTMRILAAELGCDPSAVFEHFPKKPLASGSVAQVYKARLRKEVVAVCSALARPRRLDLNEDGTLDVAVKVRHPNVAKRIFLDFQILRAVAGVADALPALKGMQLKNTLGQFSHTMTAQTDLRNEADHLLKFTHNMMGEGQIAAPQPLPGLATEAVLIETFVKGDGLGGAIKNKSPRNSELCSLGVHAYLLMLLRDNFIHQDLHPGNILYRVEDSQTGKDGRVKLELIDFGIADEIPRAVRNKFLGFLCFLLRGEGEKAADVALTWDANQTCTDRAALRRDMAHLVATKGDIFTQRVDLDGLLKDVMQLFRKHAVSIDGIYASLVVSMCVLVGFATSLDPEINLYEVAAPSVMAFALTGDVMGRLFEG